MLFILALIFTIHESVLAPPDLNPIIGIDQSLVGGWLLIDSSFGVDFFDLKFMFEISFNHRLLHR